MPRKIAFFGLVNGSARKVFGDWENHLARVGAAVVARSNGAVAVDLVGTGPVELEEPVAPGVWLRVLPISGQPPLRYDATSWRLAAYLDGVDLVHIQAAATGLCESAVLLCSLRNLPLCMTQNTLAFDSLFADVGLAQVADVVVCHSAAVARRLGGEVQVTVLPAKLAETPADDLAFGLLEVYRRLMDEGRRGQQDCDLRPAAGNSGHCVSAFASSAISPYSLFAARRPLA